MQPLRKLDVIGRTYRHLTRYQEIIAVLFKYGFGDLVDTLHARRYLDFVLNLVPSRRQGEDLTQLRRPERVRRALQELGPTFVKFGQILSGRPDLVPPDYIEEFSRLQDRVPPFAWEHVRRIVREETGEETESLFAAFAQEPLAAASIAQGHVARLPDGTEVFVKVQRPDIQRKVEVDLEIMMHLAGIMEQHLEGIQFLRPTRIVEEFARSLEREMNFLAEASHIQRFARQFSGRDGVHVPRVFPELSSERLLVMEYIHGIKASDTDALLAAGHDLQILADRGAELLMEQFFVHGFFHADPHPGNVYVLPGDVICYVDFGMVGRITRTERERFADLLMLVVSRDEKRAVDAVLNLTYYEAEPDRDQLERDLGDFIDQHLYIPLQFLEVGTVLQQLYGICYRHGLALRPHVYLMMKALCSVEGIGRRWHPDFQMVAHAEPFVKQLQWGRFHPTRLLAEAAGMGVDCVRLVQDLPLQIRTLFRQLREGKVKIEFEHRGLDRMIESHERISNRIAYAIVLAALIVGSSVMTVSDVPPTVQGVPILGLAGFLVAGALGMLLLWSIARSGRH